MGKRKKKAKKKNLATGEQSDQPPSDEQQLQPTRKRGRPRKIAVKRKVEEQNHDEDKDINKKNKALTDQNQEVKEVEAPSSSRASDDAADMKAEIYQKEKPRIRGRRKSQPRKST